MAARGRRSKPAWVLVASLLAMSFALGGQPPRAEAQTFTMYVTDLTAGGGTLFAVNPVTGTRTIVSAGGLFGGAAAGLTHAPGGDFYVSVFAGGGPLLRVRAASGTQTVVSTGGGFTLPGGIATAPNGAIYVTDRDAAGGTGALFRVDPVTGAQTVVSSGGSFVDPVDVAVGPSGEVLVADFGAAGGPGAIFRVHPVTGAQTIVSSGVSFVDPFGVTFGPGGSIYVADTNAAGGAVFRVDPTTGAQTIVSSGGSFVDPIAPRFGPDGNLYVTDLEALGGGGAVFRIDLSTGAQTVIASGGSFVDPVGLAFSSVGTPPPPPPAPNAPPAFSAPACGSTVLLPLIGHTSLSGTVTASASDPNAGQSVTLAASGLPAYATFTATPGNPATGQISANPTIFDWLAGLSGPAATVTLTATDNASSPRSATCQLTIRLRLFQGAPI